MKLQRYTFSRDFCKYFDTFSREFLKNWNFRQRFTPSAWVQPSLRDFAAHRNPEGVTAS